MCDIVDGLVPGDPFLHTKPWSRWVSTDTPQQQDKTGVGNADEVQSDWHLDCVVSDRSLTRSVLEASRHCDVQRQRGTKPCSRNQLSATLPGLELIPKHLILWLLWSKNVSEGQATNDMICVWRFNTEKVGSASKYTCLMMMIIIMLKCVGSVTGWLILWHCVQWMKCICCDWHCRGRQATDELCQFACWQWQWRCYLQSSSSPGNRHLCDPLSTAYAQLHHLPTTWLYPLSYYWQFSSDITFLRCLNL